MWPIKTKREFENELNGESKAKASWLIHDTCDFCHQPAWMQRKQLSLRLKGKKFACEFCTFHGLTSRIENPDKAIVDALACWRVKPTKPD